MLLSLKTASQNAMVRWLSSLTHYSHPPDPLQVSKYILPAGSMQVVLAVQCRYHNNPYLTSVFLPALSEIGKLHVTQLNVLQVISFWSQRVRVIPIEYFKVEEVGDGSYFTFVPLIGRMANLKVLVIGSLINDEMLSVLGVNCRNLQVLDARDDVGNLVSDIGLAYLAQCRDLRRVFFSTFANQYDLNGDKLGFTGKGLALLLSLPNIKQVTCSEYLIQDALSFLYQTYYHNQSLSLEYLLMNDQELPAKTLQILPILCPKLKVVSVFLNPDSERVFGSYLKSLCCLEVLWITTSSQCKFRELAFSSYGHHLTFLGITTYLLGTLDVIMLSECCPQLRILVLRMYSYGFDCVGVEGVPDAIFPRVEKLELVQNISITLFKILSTRIMNLRRLYCPRMRVCNLEDGIMAILEQGGWGELELLVLPMDHQMSAKTLHTIAFKTPNLKHISVDVYGQQEKEFRKFLTKFMPRLKLIDYYPDLSPSKNGVFADSFWI